MLYQRYFLRMNQSNMTHVLGLLAGLVLALGLLLVLKLKLIDNPPFSMQLQRSENLFLAITLVGCIVVYAGETARITRHYYARRYTEKKVFGTCDYDRTIK